MYYIIASLAILLGSIAPRLSSSLIDYLAISILFFGHDIKPKEIFSLSLNKFIFTLLLVILPLAIGFTDKTFEYYQLGRFFLGYFPFCVFILLALSCPQVQTSRKQLESMNSKLRFIVSFVVICAVLKSIFPNQQFPVYIVSDNIDSLNSSLDYRIYPLAPSVICSLASFHRLKNGYVYIVSAFITIALTQGKTLMLLTIIATIIPYTRNIYRGLISLRINTKIRMILLLLLISLLFAPWSRIIGEKNVLDINPFAAQTTRNIMALDAVANTFSHPFSALFGLGFGTITNSGYNILNEGLSITEENYRLVHNSQFSTENFFGSSLSRLGIVGLLFILYSTCILPKYGNWIYFLFFVLVGFGSGIIEDSSYGSALIVLYLSNNNLSLRLKN